MSSRRSSDTHARRYGLQARVIAAFVVGAALVSAVLAVSTYYFVRRSLVSQRESSDLHQTFVNAHLMRVELGAPSANVGDALSSVATAHDVRSFIYRAGTWYSNSASVTGTQIPATFTHTVVKGEQVADQQVLLQGVPTFLVGVPIPAIGVAYFEELPLTDLASTLAVLGAVLTTVAIATTAGGALVGWLISRRLVRPLGDVVSAATDIAAGSLDRRLPDDPDLQPLVTTFNEMVSALQARIQRDARFASDVTHELRSPLTAIGASMELLRTYRASLPSDGTRALDTLHVEFERFSHMVEELLEIATMDAGAAALHFTDVPLDELARVTVAGYNPDIPLSVEARAVGTWVRGDKRRLQQVLLNLLDNAETHAFGASQVTVDRAGVWATIAVDDAGPGVAPSERARIFERFYRGAASGRRGETGGTGLGLALVAEHLRAHGGAARVEDSPEGGARVVIMLPVAATWQPPAPTTTAPSPVHDLLDTPEAAGAPADTAATDDTREP
ncbi:MAG: ATP-binding protein [Acidimicrobiales bacterium]